MSRTLRFGRRRTRVAVALGSLWALACSGGGGEGSGPAESAPEAPSVSSDDETTAPEDVTPLPSAPAAPETEPSAPDQGEADEPPATEADEPSAPAASCADSLSFDDLYAAIDADLRSEDDDAPFLRYVSLGHRLNQGLCAEDLASDRDALVKVLNSLSTQVSIVQPEAIDDAGIIYRIDLRDLGWDQATQVGGVAFDDKWEAIIAASPYAVELEGDDADSAKLGAQTAVPLLFLDALIDVAVVGDLYYSLVGISESAIDLFTQLAIDFADTPVRAGTSNSRMSQQDAIIQRFEPGNAQGFYWSRFDVADTTAGQNIFSNPLDFGADVTASLFTLPNGFIAYALFDATFARISETNVLVDQFQRDGLVRNSVSCSGCHAAGVNPVTDEIRAYVESNRVDFDADTFADVQEQFLVQPELDDVIGDDIATYQTALTRAGLPLGGVDVVSSVYQRFDGPVSLEVAAGELGVTPDVLRTELVAVSRDADPALAVLGTQTIRREQFDASYLAMLCSMLLSNENQPVAAACDAALQ